MHWMRILRLSLFLICAVGPVQAEVGFLPVEDHADWQMIGRLNQAGYKSHQMCTATLIAPDKVLTAAHCVLRQKGQTGAMALRFVPGWLQGDYAAVAQVTKIEANQRFAMNSEISKQMIAADQAILTLAEPLDLPTLPVAQPLLGEPVRLLGYRHDRPHMLSDTGNCPFQLAGWGTIAMSCEAVHGNSGGPVLQMQNGQWHVVGVLSASRRDLTMAAPLPESLR